MHTLKHVPVREDATNELGEYCVYVTVYFIMTLPEAPDTDSTVSKRNTANL